MTGREYVLTAADPARAMLTVVARRCGYRAADLTGPSRVPDLVAVRRALALELARRDWPLRAIGAVLGRRHHTSVLYYLRRVGWAERVELAEYRARIRPVVRLLPPGRPPRRPCAHCGVPTRVASGFCYRCDNTCEACGGWAYRTSRVCKDCHAAGRRAS